MTKDEIARVINPNFPWVYAPTTAPTKIKLKSGRELVGYFQYVPESDKLGENNIYTFVEFGENANLYRATGDKKYLTEVDGYEIEDVEYPCFPQREVSLESLIRKINHLIKEIENRTLSIREAILFAPRFQLDWGFQIDPFNSSEFTSGSTKQVLAEGLSQLKPNFWRSNSLHGINKITNAMEEFLIRNKISESQIKELYKLIFQTPAEYREVDVAIHHRKPSNFKFPVPESITSEMDELIKWYNDSVEERKIHPVILAAMFHYRLVAIHPFLDGNGRLARVMSSLILLKNKIPPPTIDLNGRIYYLSALQKADSGDFDSWLKYFGTEVVKSMESLLNNPRK